jgi:hypothetical protein
MANLFDALLCCIYRYRGTPDNPAFWPRALKDLPFAAGKERYYTIDVLLDVVLHAPD